MNKYILLNPEFEDFYRMVTLLCAPRTKRLVDHPLFIMPQEMWGRLIPLLGVPTPRRMSLSYQHLFLRMQQDGLYSQSETIESLGEIEFEGIKQIDRMSYRRFKEALHFFERHDPLGYIVYHKKINAAPIQYHGQLDEEMLYENIEDVD